jgi:4'-phosphopantetheinyl transferase
MRAEVDVWQASLRADDEQLRWMCSLLTAEETLHMAALRPAVLRRRFAAGRAFLRSVLAGYLDVASERVAFERGPAGKPRLGDRTGGAAPLEFNLSHAGEHALCAAAWGVELGVDLEWIDPRIDPDEVAASCFAPQELHDLRRLDPGRRRRAFFTAWTRKEALVKGLGTGLSTPLAAFAVCVGPDEPPRVDWDPPLAPEGAWTLLDLAAPAGYAACLAARATEVGVRRRDWAVSPPDAEPSAA